MPESNIPKPPHENTAYSSHGFFTKQPPKCAIRIYDLCDYKKIKNGSVPPKDRQLFTTTPLEDVLTALKKDGNQTTSKPRKATTTHKVHCIHLRGDPVSLVNRLAKVEGIKFITQQAAGEVSREEIGVEVKFNNSAR